MPSGSVVVEREHRVLIFAPIGRDAQLTREVLDRASIECGVCPSIAALIDTLTEDGAGALLMTEEALDDEAFPLLVTSLGEQPPWSDIPVLLFAGGPGVEMTVRAVRSIDTLRHVTLLERPIRMAAVLTAIRAER